METQEEIDAIINNSDEPTFENTIKAYEYSGAMLSRVSRIFGALNSANTNDEIQKINVDMSPLLSKHSDDIALNAVLFDRVKSVYENQDQFNLNAEEKMLLDEMYKDFVRSGANLSDTDKEKLRAINEELSLLSVKFGQNLLAETNGFKLVIEDEADLSGLPQSVRDQAAAMAVSLEMPGKWVFTIQVPSMTPFLTYSDRRDLREKLYTAYIMKGDNDNEYDNKAIIARMASLRLQDPTCWDTYHADYAGRTMAKLRIR